MTQNKQKSNEIDKITEKLETKEIKNGTTKRTICKNPITEYKV